MNYRILFPILLVSLKAIADPGIDKSAMNARVDPCADFYQYACGTWMAANPLPADRTRWARFTELSDHNEKVLLDLLQTAASAKAPHGSIDQKIGDYFASCIDAATIEKKGMAPVKPELDRIRALRSRDDLASLVARLHLQGVGVLFRFISEPDPKDSTHMIAGLGQGGLSLPDRDYYLKTDPKSVEIRDRFERHVKTLFELAGERAEAAAADARAVLDIEMLLAKASLDRVTRRNPEMTYHLVPRTQLATLAPDFDWEAYFKGIRAPAFDKLDVEWPDFVKALPLSQPIDSWKAYLSYHVLRSAAPLLSRAFENEAFDFWTRYLAGAKEQRPRPARCVNVVDAGLGDLLGKKYVDSAFGPDAKAQITQLVEAIEKAMEEDIRTLDWMTPETKQAAIAKLHAITNNVGYPKKWRDYSRVTISRDDFYGNTRRADEAAFDRRLARIGKPTDKTEWNMTTPTVNAFYGAEFNSINFPAGILQPPFFDPKRDAAINFGAIGAVIGHEMTHGFDDQGRKFDGNGNLRDWWTAADAREFEKRAACVADEYSGFTAVDDVKVNGRLTLGENTADNGGARIALMALEDTLKGNTEKVDGFTPDQRFFLGYAQIWCENSSPEQTRLQALTNPHSPGHYRVQGVIQNMPEFQKAFSCTASKPVVTENACRVW